MQSIDFLKQALSGIEDPRINRTKLHALDNIVILALYGIISGAQGWEEIEEVALQRYDFLATILNLENGIPSHDTFSRLFARIRPQQLMSALTYWANFLSGSLENKVVAIDGKTLRHSFDRASGQSPLHSLSAFVAENSMTLAQCTVDKKENEIKKIPTLLNMIDIKDAIVTIDAIGCQKNIAKHIINKSKANYILAVKDNQPTLHSTVKEIIDYVVKAENSKYPFDTFQSVDKDHGRIETRSCLSVNVASIVKDFAPEWTGLQTIARITSLVDSNGDKKSSERYYISSLENNATLIGKSARQHWAIENSLHYVLDVTFREDDSRIRKDHAPANLAAIRRVAVSILKARKPPKVTNKRAMFKAAMCIDLANFLFAGI